MNKIIEYLSYFSFYEMILYRRYHGRMIIESLSQLVGECSFFVEFSNEVGEYAIRYGLPGNNVDICYSGDKKLCDYFCEKYNKDIEEYSK